MELRRVKYLITLIMQYLDPFSIFAIVGLKNHFLPYVYSVVLGNHLPASQSSASVLSQNQQIAAFVALLIYSVVDWVGKGSSKGGVEREVDSRGRSKEG